MTDARSSLSVFLYRDYLLLWIILMTSSIGSWLRILGTAQWLLEDTNSAWLVGVIGFVQLVVQTPALLWGGALADRLDRKQLMVLSHALTAITLIGLGSMLLIDQLTTTWVYFGIAVTAMSHVFASPSRAALIPVVLPERLLLPAASMDTASQNTAAVIGPLIFAAVAATAGLGVVLTLGGVLFLIASATPTLLRVHGSVNHEPRESTVWQETREGLSYTAKHPILPGLFLLDAGITVVSFYRDILPVLALGLFAGGAVVSGSLGAANSIGAVVGSFAALLFVAYRAKGMLVLYASLAYALFLFGFGLADNLWFGLVMIALLGAADAVTVAVRHTTVMLTTPDEMRGRAFSLMFLAAYTANNLGTIWVGFWAGLIGASNTMLFGAILAVIATLLIGYYWQPIRSFRSKLDE
ncbi:MAG: MFS transporter [Pseudomonadota bacterium]